ncbi:MAG: hypothetical protein H8E44_14365 [Planctomycetes bacterium]|nr:hypothetical protein [Planctomycetota bacterium]MBL7041152.1 hypothetical protein [Pirellulaceae bacterium]
MEARILSATMIVASTLSLGASYRTQNFIVTAHTSHLAREIGDSAETYRQDLALEWLGRELPPWRNPCPVTAQVGSHLGAGGATTFTFEHGHPLFWTMNIQGSRERLLDSVLPHEVTHTIFATHFLRPLPRWADEGACTTVEHQSEKAKQHKLLYSFLTTGRGIAFSDMFAMKEYPTDILPLYSQGYSLARYLIAQGGKRKFIQYVGDGMNSRNWTASTKKHYGHSSLLDLQTTWLGWVRQGCPAMEPKSTMVALNDGRQDGGPSHDSTIQTVRPTTADPDQVAAHVQTEPPSDGWYARQRDLARSVHAPNAPAPRVAAPSPGSPIRGAVESTSAVHSSVARPQSIGTPIQTVIPTTTVPYGTPSMVPVPLARPASAFSVSPVSRY